MVPVLKRVVSSNTQHKTVIIGILMAIAFWIMESVVHVFIFKDMDFIQQIFQPESHEVWMRFTVVCMFIGLGIYSESIITARQQAEEKVVTAHAEQQQIFETAADGMRVVTLDFSIVKANQTFAQLCGTAKNEIIGAKCYQIFHGCECHTTDCPMVRILAGEGRVEFDTVKQNQTGKTIPCIVTATPYRSPDGNLIGIVEDFKDITERINAEQQLEQYSSRLHELTKHIQSSRESECKRIARMIHDELGQMLVVFKIDLHWISSRLSDYDSSLVKKITMMKESVDVTMTVIQNIISELRPNLLDHLGLPAAIDWQITEFEQRTGIACTFHYEPDELVVPDATAIELYRILQEAMTNVARHAQASTLDVSLIQTGDHVVLSVQDNGIGIGETEQANPNSFGLIGMRERAFGLNAQVTIEGAQGEGTLIRVSVPVNEDIVRHD